MCLAIPGKVVEIVGTDLLTRIGHVLFAGVVKEISLALLPEANLNDYVLVHAGFAIAKLDEDEARRIDQQLDALDDLSAQTERTTDKSSVSHRPDTH